MNVASCVPVALVLVLTFSSAAAVANEGHRPLLATHQRVVAEQGARAEALLRFKPIEAQPELCTASSCSELGWTAPGLSSSGAAAWCAAASSLDGTPATREKAADACGRRGARLCSVKELGAISRTPHHAEQRLPGSMWARSRCSGSSGPWSAALWEPSTNTLDCAPPALPPAPGEDLRDTTAFVQCCADDVRVPHPPHPFTPCTPLLSPLSPQLLAVVWDKQHVCQNPGLCCGTASATM